MSYADKIAQAMEAITKHNEGVGTEEVVDIDDFIGRLKRVGGTSDARLRRSSWEDLEGLGLPLLLAKEIAEIFRKGEAAPRRPVVTERQAQAMSPEELLERYDPRDPDNFVGKRLKDLSKGQPFIVFNTDGTVNREASVQLLQEIRNGYPARETFAVEGRPQKIYRVGERPEELANENPLYPGRALRPNGDCDQTNRSWNGVTDPVRILVYLAVTRTREIRIAQIDDAHRILDQVMSGDAEAAIRQRNPQASILYDDLASKGNLPSLKVAPSGTAVGGTVNDPFGHKKF